MTDASITIGTRGSQLALWQSNWVKAELIRHHPGLTVELEVIKTSGDKILDVPLAKVGGKGLFVKEIEEALMAGRVDLAVHSMKDMPGELPESLEISAIPEREIPYDVLIARQADGVDGLPEQAVVGTSSLRRASQLLYHRPDIRIIPLRGNLDTRINKLATQQLDAIILAAAGLKRLGMAGQITEQIRPEILLPAVGQGALCIESRKSDERVRQLLRPLHHEPTAWAVNGERGFMKRLQGGCQVPIAAHGTVDGRQLHLIGMVAEVDGSVMFRDSITGPVDRAESLGVALAERLIERGAGPIIKRLIEEADI